MRSWPALAILLGYVVFISQGSWADSTIRLQEAVKPGGAIIGMAPKGSAVHVDGKRIRVSPDGWFLLGAGRDAKGSILVKIDHPDGHQITREITVLERSYDIQRIDGLPSRKVTPNKEDQEKIAVDYTTLVEAKKIDSSDVGFARPAIWPTTGPISGVFGSQRILNGKPKSPHRGVDVAAPTGTPVGSMLGGIVTVADKGMYYTGGTVMVDHGHGLQSLYAHLSEVSVKTGQRLEQGETLGKIGATGRVTGPHLHLGLYWFETALDPALLLGPMPSASN